MDDVSILLQRIDDYAEARERLRRSPDDPDDEEYKFALAGAVDAWQRLIDARQLVRI